MVTSAINAPSPGQGLLDRLTAGSERAGLRPLLPYYTDVPSVDFAENSGRAEAATPSSTQPMSEDSRALHPDWAIDMQRRSDAPTSPAAGDTSPVKRAPNDARGAKSAPITAGAQPADAGNAFTSPRVKASPEISIPSPRMPTAPQQQPPAVVEPRIGQPGTVSPVARPAIPDSTPGRELRLRPAMPQARASIDPASAAMRSRDASQVSPLPRPAYLRVEPTIEIHIGRIEVRAQTSASPPTTPAQRAATPSTSSLAAHLGARGRGARS
jgi:hypothetical protein